MIPDKPMFTIEIVDNSIGLEGYVCIHAVGPAGSSGGMRCVGDVTKAEVQLLARAMSYKYSFFGIRQGGAKAGLRLPYGATEPERTRLISAMAHHLEPMIKRSNIWSVWTDMNFYRADLEHFYKSIGIVWHSSGTGGSTIRTAITGAWSIMAVAEGLKIAARDARIVIEGYGGVGQAAADFLAAKSFPVVALSNHVGAVHNAKGLDLITVKRAKEELGAEWVLSNGPWENLPLRELFDVPCEIIVPGARVYSVDKGTATRINARAMVPVANVPCTEDALALIASRGILYIPDYVVNGGGVCGWIQSVDDTFGNCFRAMLSRLMRKSERSGVSVLALCNDISHASFEASIVGAYQKASYLGRVLDRVRKLPILCEVSAKKSYRLTVCRMRDRLNSVYPDA